MNRNEMNAIGPVMSAIETATPAAPDLPSIDNTQPIRRPVLALASGFAAVLLVVGVVAAGVSLSRDDSSNVGAAFAGDQSPFTLTLGEAACVLTVGDSVETADPEPIQMVRRPSYLLFMNQLGPLGEGDRDERSEGHSETEMDWTAQARIRDGVLIVRVVQPTVGEQSESWLLTDIPPEGMVMSGTWGGPYDGSDRDGDSYFLTCWTGPTA